MSLPMLRPLLSSKQPSEHLPTPPSTSSPYKRLRDGPPEHLPAVPARRATYDDVLLAQEGAEDDHLQIRATNIWRESQDLSCIEDNETTPWLQHTKWPERFRSRPLDIISASTKLPARGPYERHKVLMLGDWRGAPIQSSTATEARLQILMRAVDDMFNRAEATLSHTSYQSRCWLTSYGHAMFRNRPLRIMPPKTAQQYKSKWKHFICYVFRAFELGPQKCREVHNMPLSRNDRKMMSHVLDLVARILERENDEVDKNEDADEEDADDREDDEDSDNDETVEQSPDIEGCGNQGDDDVEDSNHDEDSEAEGNDEDSYDLEVNAGQPKFSMPEGARLELSEALFQLSMMFWTYQSQDGVMDSSTIVHFTAVIDIHRSSLVYRDAYNLTPDLAALIWIGRLLFLEYSLPQYEYERKPLCIPGPRATRTHRNQNVWKQSARSIWYGAAIHLSVSLLSSRLSEGAL